MLKCVSQDDSLVNCEGKYDNGLDQFKFGTMVMVAGWQQQKWYLNSTGTITNGMILLYLIDDGVVVYC